MGVRFLQESSILGEHRLAEQHFREALDIPDAEPGSVHGYYATFLFEQGRDTEALELIAQARRLNPDDPEVFTIIGEALLDHDHPQLAAPWFTTGLARQLDSLTDLHIDDLRYDIDLAMLTQGRHRARQTQGMPPDHIDELAQQLQESRSATASTH